MKISLIFKPAVLSVLLGSLFAVSSVQANSSEDYGHGFDGQQQHARGWDDRWDDHDDDDDDDWDDRWEDFEDQFKPEEDNQGINNDKINLKEAIAKAEEKIGGIAKEASRDKEWHNKGRYEAEIIKSSGHAWVVLFNAASGQILTQYPEHESYSDRRKNATFYRNVSNENYISATEAVVKAEKMHGLKASSVEFEGGYRPHYEVKLVTKHGGEREVSINARKY